MSNPTISVTEIRIVGPAMSRRREESPRELDLGGIREVKPSGEEFTIVTLNTGDKVRVKGNFSNYEDLVNGHA